jgi:predicted helicase
MPAISKQDIFYYVYGVLSSTEFRDNFEMDVKKMGPRVPLLANFDSFAKIGKELFNLQLDYRNAPIPDFVKVEISDNSVDRSLLYKVDKMRYGKLANGGIDRSVLQFNQYIKIVGIPESVQSYMINGRSALDWAIDQFKFSKDKDTGIINDPNLFSADEEFILNTILRIIEVSKRTVDLLESLPHFEFVN